MMSEQRRCQFVRGFISMSVSFQKGEHGFHHSIPAYRILLPVLMYVHDLFIRKMFIRE